MSKVSAAPNFALVVPILHPGPLWSRWLESVASQDASPALKLIVDSGSSDDERRLAMLHGFEIIGIERDQFDHGRTRQLAVDHAVQKSNVVVFLTQDAVLADGGALRKLLAWFADPRVGAVWGRQLPHPGASAIAAHARLANYPPVGRVVEFSDRRKLGIKAAFCSDSFAAYRTGALVSVGGFAWPTVLGEDMHIAARMLKAGWRVVYATDACVFHSHDYSCLEELARYFDTGAFHADNKWLLEEFGGASGEGKRFALSELRYLARHAPLAIPRALLGTASKLIGYKLGRRYWLLPPPWRVRLGMNKSFWKRS